MGRESLKVIFSEIVFQPNPPIHAHHHHRPSVGFRSISSRFRVDVESQLENDSSRDSKTTEKRLEIDSEWRGGRWWWGMSPGVGFSWKNYHTRNLLRFFLRSPVPVRLRFEVGTVRAVPVFGSGGSSVNFFLCFSAV